MGGHTITESGVHKVHYIRGQVDWVVVAGMVYL